MTDFEGFDDLGQQLQEFGDDLRLLAELLDVAIDSGVERTALQVERTAKRKAPVDTGTLRGSIEARNVGDYQYAVGTNVEYAPHVEYGRGSVTADDGYLRFKVDGEVFYRKSVGPAKAQPFLRPALRAHRSDLVENIEDEIDRLVAEVF